MYARNDHAHGYTDTTNMLSGCVCAPCLFTFFLFVRAEKNGWLSEEKKGSERKEKKQTVDNFVMRASTKVWRGGL